MDSLNPNGTAPHRSDEGEQPSAVDHRRADESDVADARSDVADARDRLADERDQAADKRDRVADVRERHAVGGEAAGEGVLHLRVLIANERRDRLELLAEVVGGLGHQVIAREIYVSEVGSATAREQPDVALVGLGSSSAHALALISEIVREASCPVIAILHADDPAYVHEAAKRGVFAYIIDGTPAELQSAIDITLQRFAEYQSLQGAFGRRALIEQAKGILMARDSIGADAAFARLREHSQRNGRKLSDVAAAIVESHLLLLPPTQAVPGA
jgi:AmiR/NasT family two-component response regulator